jgi:hypothetical protein
MIIRPTRRSSQIVKWVSVINGKASAMSCHGTIVVKSELQRRQLFFCVRGKVSFDPLLLARLRRSTEAGREKLPAEWARLAALATGYTRCKRKRSDPINHALSADLHLLRWKLSPSNRTIAEGVTVAISNELSDEKQAILL